MIWNAPCQRCRQYVAKAFARTDMVEYVETGRYECRWTCESCGSMYGFDLSLVAARDLLSRGGRHVVVYRLGAEEHAGGPPIDHDDEIDFWQAWQPGQDESPDAVYGRVWRELIGDTESKEDQHHA